VGVFARTQMFWEAFPAEGGAARTTYMFAYSDAQPERPTFEALLDRYFEDLQKYQVKTHVCGAASQLCGHNLAGLAMYTPIACVRH
jgi:hypothetical protein